MMKRGQIAERRVYTEIVDLLVEEDKRVRCWRDTQGDGFDGSCVCLCHQEIQVK